MSSSQKTANLPDLIPLNNEQSVGHADHWACFSNNIVQDIPNWLQNHIEHATIAQGLQDNHPKDFLLLSHNDVIHLKQIISIDEQQKPISFINAFPCVNSPYGQWATIEHIFYSQSHQEAILRLKTDDDSIFYAFDQLYAINHHLYEKGKRYFVNLSAIAYQVSHSKKSEVIKVTDPEAIRYHLAYNDILAKNQGKIPENLESQIAQWEVDGNTTLEPIDINVGHMCAYLFGDTIGQQDEAWCQGQVLGKQTTVFQDTVFALLDVVILRESVDNPVVIRLAVNQAMMEKIEVGDYIQANIWLQAAIYQQNQ